MGRTQLSGGLLQYFPSFSCTLNRKIPIQKDRQKMDQVDKMKLTKYGFRFNLLGSSSFLSVLGIVVSIIGIIGSIACFVMGTIFGSGRSGRKLGGFAMVVLYTIGAVLLIIMIPYLAMWILLKIKTSKQDIPGIERIGKVYSYVSGSLEIIAMIARIIYSAWTLASFSSFFRSDLFIRIESVYILGAVIYFVFACLKIHGIRVENNKLIGMYIEFRYVLFALHMIGFIIYSIFSILIAGELFLIMAIIGLIVGGVYFILDIGLTVILHSIRVDRENTAGTENPMKNF